MNLKLTNGSKEQRKQALTNQMNEIEAEFAKRKDAKRNYQMDVMKKAKEKQRTRRESKQPEELEALNYRMKQMNLKIEQNNNDNIVNDYQYGTDAKGRKLYIGPNGGVYYFTAGRNKKYVG
eukprot:UN11435